MTRLRQHRAQRAFTLIEVLVSAAILGFVSIGAMALVTSQQRAFQQTSTDRGLQETARTAVSELAINLRRAGYGIEPWLAFDFGPITNAPASWPGAASLATSGYPGGTPGGTLPGCSPTVAVGDRDHITSSDEIVFYSRDPGFSRKLASAPSTAASATTLTFDTPLKTPLYQGQILQVMCAAATAWAYVTVGSIDEALTTVTLETSCSGGFPHQQSLLTSDCFTTAYSTVRVFKVDRFHYYVDRFDDPDTGGQRPYLMLDRGLWNNGAALVEPVAPDVEDVQFAYVFPRSATQLVGATSETRLTDSAESIDLAAVPPSYHDATGAASRTTHHPGNIRAVRVSVVVRNATPDQGLTGASYHTIPAALNRGAITTADPNYRRVLVETTESIRNLDSRGPFYPPYSVNNGADGLNLGGG